MTSPNQFTKEILTTNLTSVAAGCIRICANRISHVDVISLPKKDPATKWPKQSKKPQERWYKINVTSDVSTV